MSIEDIHREYHLHSHTVTYLLADTAQLGQPQLDILPVAIVGMSLFMNVEISRDMATNQMEFAVQYGNQSEISKFDVIFLDQKEVVHHIRLQMAKWRVCGGCLSVGTIKFAFPNPNHLSMPVGRAYIANDRHCTNTPYIDRITCILHRSYWMLAVLTILHTFSIEHSYVIHDVSCTMTKLQVCSWCVMIRILKIFSGFEH